MNRDAPRILVVRFSSMGDIILITPVLAALKDRFPRARLDVLIKARYADLLRDHPHVDELLLLEDGQGLVALAGELRTHGYDLILDLHANLRSRVLCMILPAAMKLRVRKEALRRRLMVILRHRSEERVHMVDRYLRSLRPLGIQTTRDRPRLSPLPGDLADADRFLDEQHVGERALVGLHPGARWPGKRWPAERFARVGQELTKQGGRSVLVFAGPGEERLASQVAQQIGASAVSVVGQSLRQLMALIQRCSIYITNDSGPMHLATALDVPVVAIFGPTHPVLGFWPLGQRDVVLTADLSCSPCSLHGGRRCPRNWSCLEEIKVRDVLEAAEKILCKEEIPIQAGEKSDRPDREDMSRIAVFLDRDGTINREVHYLSGPEQLELLAGAGEAIKRLNDLGLLVVVVTNQSGVARGYLSEEKLESIHRLLKDMLAEQGARLDAIYYCPELPESGSSCRKPETGMMEQAAREHHIDLKRSYVVGDMAKDIEMGQRAGSRTVLVLTGYGQEIREKVQPDHVARDLAEAVRWIERDLKGA